MTDGICRVAGCERPARYPKQRLCGAHYQRIRKHGSSSLRRPSVEDRFWAKVDRSGPCWIWTAKRSRQGYGRFWVNGGEDAAHRVVWELERGPIPAGLTIDHLCRNTSCVNPAHLEPVTLRENILRSTGVAAVNAVKTGCKRGHEFNVANTRINKGGGRVCRACMRDHQRAYRARLAA